MKRLALIVLAVCGITFSLAAQTQARFQALFLYNFTRYIEWPAFNSHEFVIGVVGKSPIYSELLTIAQGKKVSLKDIKVKKFASGEEITACQILFVSNDASSSLGTYATSLQGKNTLIITEKSGLINKGAGINFVINDGKQKFELSRSAMNKNGLKVNNQLVDMATVID